MLVTAIMFSSWVAVPVNCINESSNIADAMERYSSCIKVSKKPIGYTQRVERTSYFDIDLSENLQEFLISESVDKGLPPELVAAVIVAESHCDINTVSKTGDYGLMQINIGNHEWLNKTLGIDDFMDPQQNMTAGIYILSQMYKKYADIDMSLMAYNYGEGRAKKLWLSGVFETDYTRKVNNIIKDLDRKEVQD